MIDLIKSKVLNDVSAQALFVNNEFGCYSLAKNLYTVRDGLCGKLVPILDTHWFSLSILALYGLFSIPVFIMVANNLARKQKPGNNQDYLDELNRGFVIIIF